MASGTAPAEADPAPPQARVAPPPRVVGPGGRGRGTAKPGWLTRAEAEAEAASRAPGGVGRGVGHGALLTTQDAVAINPAIPPAAGDGGEQLVRREGGVEREEQREHLDAAGADLAHQKTRVKDARQRWKQLCYEYTNKFIESNAFKHEREAFQRRFDGNSGALFAECTLPQLKRHFVAAQEREAPALDAAAIGRAWEELRQPGQKYSDAQLAESADFAAQRAEFRRKGWKQAFVECKREEEGLRAPPPEGIFVRDALAEEGLNREEVLRKTRAEARKARRDRLPGPYGKRAKGHQPEGGAGSGGGGEGREHGGAAREVAQSEEASRRVQTLLFPYLILRHWTSNATGDAAGAELPSREWCEEEARNLLEERLSRRAGVREALGLSEAAVREIAGSAAHTLEAELQREPPGFLASLAALAPALMTPGPGKDAALAIVRDVPQAPDGAETEDVEVRTLAVRAAILQILEHGAVPVARVAAAPVPTPMMQARTAAVLLRGAMLAGETPLEAIRAQEAALVAEYVRVWPGHMEAPRAAHLKALRRSFWMGGTLSRGGAPPNSLVAFRHGGTPWDIPVAPPTSTSRRLLRSSLVAAGVLVWPPTSSCWYSGFAEGLDVVRIFRSGPDAPLYSLASSGGILELDVCRDAALARILRWYTFFTDNFGMASWPREEQQQWLGAAARAVNSAANATLAAAITAVFLDPQVAPPSEQAPWVRERLAYTQEAKSGLVSELKRVLFQESPHAGPRDAQAGGAPAGAAQPRLVPGIQYPLSLECVFASRNLGAFAKRVANPHDVAADWARCGVSCTELATYDACAHALRAFREGRAPPDARGEPRRVHAFAPAQGPFEELQEALLHTVRTQRAHELHSYARFYAQEVPHLMAQQSVLLEELPAQALELWGGKRAAAPDGGDAEAAAFAVRTISDLLRRTDATAGQILTDIVHVRSYAYVESMRDGASPQWLTALRTASGERLSGRAALHRAAGAVTTEQFPAFLATALALASEADVAGPRAGEEPARGEAD